MVRCLCRRGEFEMAEQSPLVRQWILLRTLCANRGGLTIKEMATEMSVSDKTIRRDIETFQQAGFPLQEKVGDFGRKHWQIDRDRVKLGMSFTFDEAIALYMGRRFLEPLAGTLFWDAALRAFSKIRALLTARHSTDLMRRPMLQTMHQLRWTNQLCAPDNPQAL